MKSSLAGSDWQAIKTMQKIAILITKETSMAGILGTETGNEHRGYRLPFITIPATVK